jgi:hypothetical protein
MVTPEGLILCLTERCNFRCSHCFGDYGSGSSMALETAVRCMRQAARHHLFGVTLTGGEPTLLGEDYLLHCIRELTSLGLHSVLASNGSWHVSWLEQLAAAGLRELHLSFDKWRAQFVSVDHIKSVLTHAESLGIKPVIVIIEANSFRKYRSLFGSAFLEKYAKGVSHNFRPLVFAGRATLLPRREFVSRAPIALSHQHQFNIHVRPNGDVSFCPINEYFKSRVDLTSEWLGSTISRYAADPVVDLLLKEGVNGLVRRASRSQERFLASRLYECSLCLNICNASPDAEPQ